MRSEVFAMYPFRIALDPEILEKLGREVHGEGGFQSLLRLLRSSLHDQSLEITSQEVAERILRAVDKYGEGGFQERIRPIADQISRS